MNTDITNKQVIEIIQLLKDNNFPKAEIDVVDKAMHYAIKHHAGQLRKSGEPFVTHPLAVAAILIKWGMDYQSISAGLLHDIVEDTDVSLAEIKSEFGDEIAHLVEVITKVSTFSSKNRADDKYTKDKDVNAYIMQVFLGMSKDMRVMLIKLADRFHNMSTIRFLKPEKQKRIAFETKEIYANIAGRLGMFSVKSDLSDMCMQVLNPSEYKKAKSYIDGKIKINNNTFQEAIQRVRTCLDNNHISYDLEYRIKSVYSTHEKITANDASILDLFAIRIIVDQPLDCYLCLGIIHSNFYNLANTFKDYISTPKANLYQSLHTGIVFKNLNMEVQIRTAEMNRNANYGVAAHWRYKENVGKDSYLGSMLNMISEKAKNDETLSFIKNISKQKFINVLDKNNMTWKSILEGLSVLDYIYMLDKNKFSYLNEVFINDVVANMYQIIQAGETIEVTYSSHKTINKGWINFTKDNSIKKFINDELQNIHSNLENSVEEFVLTLSKECGSYCNKKFILEFISKHFNMDSIKDFLDAMKYIRVSYNDLVKLFGNHWKEKKEMISKIKSQSWKWLIANSLFKMNESLYFSDISITKCCSKVPPLDVIGVLNGDILEVHKFDCPRINKKDKIIVMKWDNEKVKKSTRMFRTKIITDGAFSSDCSPAIVATITKYRAVISTFIMHKDKTSKRFSLDLVLYVKNYSNLEKIMTELQNKGIIYSWKLI